MGPDYAKCKCGLTMKNAASPPVNGGLAFSDEVYAVYGDEMWTWSTGVRV